MEATSVGGGLELMRLWSIPVIILFHSSPTPSLVLGEGTKRTWSQLDPQDRPRNLRLLTLHLCPWNVPSTCLPHSQKLLQQHSLKRVRCCWAHLDGIRAWTQLRFWGRCRELLFLWCPRHALYVSSLAYKPAIYQSGVACVFLQSLPALHVPGPVSDFTREAAMFAKEHPVTNSGSLFPTQKIMGR